MSLVEQIFENLSNGDISNLKQQVAALIRNQIHESDSQSTITQGPHEPVMQIHPLGFLCIRWQIDTLNSLRVHLWHKKYNFSQKPNWPIHDHIFSFRSAVVVGRIQNKTYSVAKTSRSRRWPLFNVTYKNGCSELSQTGRSVGIIQTGAILQASNSQYEVAHGVLHRSILRSEFAVTVLSTTRTVGPEVRARVVGNDVNAGLTFNRDASTDVDAVLLLKESLQLLESQVV